MAMSPMSAMVAIRTIKYTGLLVDCFNMFCHTTFDWRLVITLVTIVKLSFSMNTCFVVFETPFVLSAKITLVTHVPDHFMDIESSFPYSLKVTKITFDNRVVMLCLNVLF